MPSHEVALGRLLDMGIPRGRALAALKRSKNDSMAAAERVFAGEFDDIPSDDEGTDEPGEIPNGLPTPSESLGPSDEVFGRGCSISRGVEEVLISDDAPSDEDDDEEMEFDDFLDDDCQPTMKDPYASAFFSKDRVERLAEPVPESLEAEVTMPPGYIDAPGGKEVKKLKVKVVDCGLWMSGCPEGSEQSFLFQSYNTVSEGSMPCSGGCGHKFPRRPEHFFALFPTFPAYTAYLASIIQQTCPKCKQVTCFACGEATEAQRKSRKGKDTEDEIIDCLFHCPAIQGIIIGIGLQMVERAFNDNVNVSAKPSSSESAPTKKRKLARSESMDEDGISLPRKLFGKMQAKGVGYSGSMKEDRTGEVAAEGAQKEKDTMTATLLSQVACYLPNVKRRRTFTSDFMVHPTALAHLRRRSGFVNDLLMNDSLLDMMQRNTIYVALLDWLEIVANHEALAAMQAMPLMRPTTTEPGPDAGTITVTYEGRPSPRELLETIVIQATSALKGLSSTAAREPNSEQNVEKGFVLPTPGTPYTPTEVSEASSDKEQNAALKMFCGRILSARDNIDQHLVNSRGEEFVQRIHSELPAISTGNPAADNILKAGENEEATKKIYEDWARRVRFAHCDLTEPADPSKKNYHHAFNKDITQLNGMDAPKRSLAIAKELGVLSTNIPTAWDSSIFLRVDEDRVDCIKAMIIGPKDTPYENGCFVFDIFLPIDYNVQCPRVKFMTTNGGLYRYNPNLYNDGKVCLSLLGTWSGPGWISGKSTLLQVLISIQSLIFCEEPYLNEPGWANQVGTPASMSYSANVRRMVLHDAMANNIKSPPFPFENEVKTHFRLKADAIRAQLERWEKLDDGKSTKGDGDYGGLPSQSTPGFAASTASGSKTSFVKYAEELRRLLDELAPPNGSAPPAKAAPPVKAAPATRRKLRSSKK